MEEGELRDSMHGEHEVNDGLHGEPQGVAINNSGPYVNVSVDKGESAFSHVFIASNNGPVNKRKPIKACSNRRERAQSIKVSPIEGGRPKKRCRSMEDDPFDLDRFIGIVNNNSVGVNSTIIVEEGSQSQQEEVGSKEVIDLEGIPSGEVVINEAPVDPVEGEGDRLSKEMEATVKLGAILGVKLDDHAGLVKQSIIDEGNNVGLS